MKSGLLFLAWAFLLCAKPVSAQVRIPGTYEGPESGLTVAQLLDAYLANAPGFERIGRFPFDNGGCPGGEPWRRELFDGLKELDVSEWNAGRIIHQFLRIGLPQCPSLESEIGDWVASRIEALASDPTGADRLMSLLSGIPHEPELRPARVREALLVVAASDVLPDDPGFGGALDAKSAALRTYVRGMDIELRTQAYLMLFSRGLLTRDFGLTEFRALSDSLGAAFRTSVVESWLVDPVGRFHPAILGDLEMEARAERETGRPPSEPTLRLQAGLRSLLASPDPDWPPEVRSLIGGMERRIGGGGG